MDTAMNAVALASALAAALWGAGCVAIPVGGKTYRHEYPSHLANAPEPAKTTYANIGADLDESAQGNVSVAIGLAADITVEQPQVQHYKTVSVEKKKRLAIGLFPSEAQQMFRPKGSLTPIRSTMYYCGNGEYSTQSHGYAGSSALHGGGALWAISLGIVSTPFSLIAEIFGPFEKDLHFLGGIAESSSTTHAVNVTRTSTTYASEDIELLRKFPMSEREDIGAWTYHENDAHPHNTFWHGFEGQWFGVHKYCNYFVKDEGETGRTAPADPKVTTTKDRVHGPYSVTLSLPSLGYVQTLDVPEGETSAVFPLADIANGQAKVDGTISFSQSGQFPANAGSPLALAEGREYPVTVSLPKPRLGAIHAAGDGGHPNDASAPQPSPSAVYRIVGVERGDAGELVVRIAIEDTSRTFEIDRQVQPELKRMFRDQSDHADTSRRELIRWSTEDEGKTLVYTVSFAE